jgi:hypothetical protein
VERAAKLSLKLGVALELKADGSVKILGKLDSAPQDAPASPAGGAEDDDALTAYEASCGVTGRA